MRSSSALACLSLTRGTLLCWDRYSCAGKEARCTALLNAAVQHAAGMDMHTNMNDAALASSAHACLHMFGDDFGCAFAIDCLGITLRMSSSSVRRACSKPGDLLALLAADQLHLASLGSQQYHVWAIP
eukprot:scaffold208145_cov17-Tisochrysis_lutea.AAC.3